MLTNIYLWFKTNICPEFPYYSLSLSLSSMVELRRTSATTTMGFNFLRSCFMGFIFLWFWLWVHLISFVLASVLVLASVSATWSRSRKRADGGLERMELDLGLRPGLGIRLSLCLGQNGARSQIDHYLCFLGFLFFFFFFAFGLWVW